MAADNSPFLLFCQCPPDICPLGEHVVVGGKFVYFILPIIKYRGKNNFLIGSKFQTEKGL